MQSQGDADHFAHATICRITRVAQTELHPVTVLPHVDVLQFYSWQKLKLQRHFDVRVKALGLLIYQWRANDRRCGEHMTRHVICDCRDPAVLHQSLVTLMVSLHFINREREQSVSLSDLGSKTGCLTFECCTNYSLGARRTIRDRYHCPVIENALSAHE
jgi:hypothetical protein